MSQMVASSPVLARWEFNSYVVELYPSTNNRSNSNKVTAYVTPLNRSTFTLQNISAPFLLRDVDVNVLRKCQRILEAFFSPDIELDSLGHPREVKFEYRIFYNLPQNLPLFQIRDPRALSLPTEPSIPVVVKVYLNTKDQRIQQVCIDRVDAFVANPFEKPSQLEDICRHLALSCLIENEHITHEVFRRFLGRINDYLLEPIFVAGLADAIDKARPDHLIPEHLAEILDVLAGKIGSHSTLSEKTLLELLNALARISNAIVDAKGKINFSKKEELKKTLEQLKGNSSLGVKICAVYAQEALSRVSDTESLFAKVFRISAGLVKGTWCLYAAFNRMDPKYALDGFFALQQGADKFIEDFAKPFAEQAKEVIGSIQDIAGNISNARELVERLRGKLGWFEQLRYIDWLIASNCFRSLEKFLCDSRLEKNENLLFLVVSKLHKVILTHPHRQIRSETIKLFAHLYYADIFWLKDVKEDFSLKLLNTSPRLATKAMIVSCLQFYQTSEELRVVATNALDLITESANSNATETQLIQAMRREPLSLASYTTLIEARDQNLNPALPMLEEFPPATAGVLSEEPNYRPNPSSSYLLPAATGRISIAPTVSPAASPLPTRPSNTGSFSPLTNRYSANSASGHNMKPSATYAFNSPLASRPTTQKPPAQTLPVTIISSTQPSSIAEEDFQKGDKFAKEGHFKEAVIWLKKAAEQGHVNAQYDLGVCYNDGQGVDQNFKEAASWCLKAAEQGHVDAEYGLGVCYSYGQGVDQNLKEAVKWYQKAADQGHAAAQFNLGGLYYMNQNFKEAVSWYRKGAGQGYAPAQYGLGVCYNDGQGVDQNFREAVSWYQKAADQDYVNAQFNLGLCRYYGEGMDQDLKDAVSWYRKAADQGHAPAQYGLGVCYNDGQGVNQDLKEAVKWYRKAAEQGYASAQVNLGFCYKNGEGVDRDYQEAVKWYRKATDQGLATAQNSLGICYYEGEGVDRDYQEAVKWYRKATDQGLDAAQFNLGICYQNGLGVDRDYQEAVKWFRKAADQGHTIAQSSLGACYYDGQGVDRDFKQAASWYRKAADQGHATAQFNLGNCYENGQGLDRDFKEAASWYLKAADQGHAAAQFLLGNCHEDGQGVDRDFKQAASWYRKAADQGYAAAQFNLGIFYYRGQGVDENFKEAVSWFRKAADRGLSAAYYQLGFCYGIGQGVDEDLKEAVSWFRKAADQGHAASQYCLGDCYYDGQGIEKNLKEAVSWYRKAADQGHVDAQHRLGVCYYDGQGIEKNLKEAVSWLRKAADQGHTSAAQLLDSARSFDSK